MTKCILIVDDEPAIVTGLRLRAESAGWQTLSASDGVRGMQLAKDHCPHLIILDMRMPCQDGMQTLAAIRSCPETIDIPVVMISGCAEDRQAALDAGANAFLPKPHRSAEFLEVISELTTAAPRDTQTERV